MIFYFFLRYPVIDSCVPSCRCSVSGIPDVVPDGCRNVQGKPFTINNITKTLANVRYTGLYKFGDVEVPGGMPQIIAPDLWDACQARTQAKPPRIRQRANYLLLGKVFCGHCGGALVGLSGRGKSGTAHRYYGHSAGARAICKKHAET